MYIVWFGFPFSRSLSFSCSLSPFLGLSYLSFTRTLFRVHAFSSFLTLSQILLPYFTLSYALSSCPTFFQALLRSLKLSYAISNPLSFMFFLVLLCFLMLTLFRLLSILLFVILIFLFDVFFVNFNFNQCISNCRYFDNWQKTKNRQ